MRKAIGLFLMFSIVACTSTKVVKNDKKVLYEILTQQPDGGGNIHFFEILTEPNEIAMLQNDENLKKKISAADVKNANFIILNMGEKPTGGYAITVDNVVETDKNIIITVKETSPKPGAMVTQNIAYPFCVVKINSKKDIIVK